MTTPVVAIVRYSGQPEYVFTIFVEWNGIDALKANAATGAFKLLRAYEYDKSREFKFYEAVSSRTDRFGNDRKTRTTKNLKSALAAIDNTLIPIYKM